MTRRMKLINKHVEKDGSVSLFLRPPVPEGFPYLRQYPPATAGLNAVGLCDAPTRG